MDEDIAQKMLGLAKEFARARSWSWREPVDVRLSKVTPGQREWRVRTNIQAMGMNIELVIRESDMTVVRAGYIPR